MDTFNLTRIRNLFVVSFCLLPQAGLTNSAPEFSGFYKNLYSLTTTKDSFRNRGLTDRTISVDNFHRIRLKSDWALGEAITSQVHYQLRFSIGDLERTQHQLATQPGHAPNPHMSFTRTRVRYLDLESDIWKGSNRVVAHDLDRLYIRWISDWTELTVGRQTIHWGSGLIWTPTDLFSGFSPTEIDQDEKPGVDVVRLTGTPTHLTSLDFIAEPLDEGSGPYGYNADDSSLALRGSTHIQEYDIAILGGRVAGDKVVGGDFSGYLGNAGLRGEFLFTGVQEDHERDYTRALLSIDYAFGHPWNAYAALEYFYNGLGTDNPDEYLPRFRTESVQKAFRRGNAFNLGRQYLGTILRTNPSSLWSMQAVTLLNLDDRSARECITLTRSVSDNIDLLFGANIGLGSTGTEFGGRAGNHPTENIESSNLFFVYAKAYF